MSRLYQALKHAAERGRQMRSEPDLGAEDIVREPEQGAYERIAQEVLNGSASQELQVVLMSSAVEGEGVSTVARELARLLSDHAPVLLLDGNPHAASQHEAFGLSRGPGLTDVLAERLDVHDAIHFGVWKQLSFLAAGSDNGALLEATRLESLKDRIIELNAGFRWIIVDSPPLTSSSEAAPLLKLSDAAIMVVRAERTRSHVVERAKRDLQASGTRILGAVLNRRKYHIPEFIYRLL